MTDEINLVGVGFGVDVVDEGGDLGGGLGDGKKASDGRGGGFGAVGEGVDAVVVGDEVRGEGREGGGVGGHAVEEDDGVVGGGARWQGSGVGEGEEGQEGEDGVGEDDHGGLGVSGQDTMVLYNG